MRYYNLNVQATILAALLSDPAIMRACRQILRPEWFDEALRPVVGGILEYWDRYGGLPDRGILACRFDTELVETLFSMAVGPMDESSRAWVRDLVETFCRHRAMEHTVITAPALIEKGEYEIVEEAFRSAVSLRLDTDYGVAAWEDPVSVLERFREMRGTTPTGWPTVDHKLFGGFSRGELNIFAGAPGAGKSLFLQNLAVTWASAGLRCFYVTLELSVPLTLVRIYGMVTGSSVASLTSDPEAAADRIRATVEGWEDIVVKFMPSGTSVRSVESLMMDAEAQIGRSFDAVFVDYMDLLHPIERGVDRTNLFVKDKYVSEELRDFAVRRDVLLVTASQLNRGSIQDVELDMADIAGGISKINTADNVIAIRQGRKLREDNLVELQFLKTRSSAGVFSKILLHVNPESLRICEQSPGGDTVVHPEVRMPPDPDTEPRGTEDIDAEIGDWLLG